MNEALAKAYEQIHTKPSDVEEHLDTFSHALLAASQVSVQPKVIELGVRYGVSTVEWIVGCWASGGHLWAVDGAPPVIEPTMEYDLLNPLMDLDCWDFILGWDTELHVLDQLPWNVDIVFIDTNHIYEETLVELETYLPRVRPGGRIFLHDTAIERTGNARPDQWQPPYPVLTAVKEFCGDHYLRYDNVENCCGLATIYVPGPA